MRAALHLLATRVLRSRAGLALLLTMLVLGIVGTTRVLAGPADPGLAARPPAPPLEAVTPTVPDDGLLFPESAVSPTKIPGAETPESVAKSFAIAWVTHTGASADDWHSRLAARATATLADELSGVDPVIVPADRITGEPTLIPRAATIVEVVIPVDSGELRLRLLATDDRWLVDGVDWGRA